MLYVIDPDIVCGDTSWESPIYAVYALFLSLTKPLQRFLQILYVLFEYFSDMGEVWRRLQEVPPQRIWTITESHYELNTPALWIRERKTQRSYQRETQRSYQKERVHNLLWFANEKKSYGMCMIGNYRNNFLCTLYIFPLYIFFIFQFIIHVYQYWRGRKAETSLLKYVFIFIKLSSNWFHFVQSIFD